MSELTNASIDDLVIELRSRAGDERGIYIADIKAGQVKRVQWNKAATVIMVPKEDQL